MPDLVEFVQVLARDRRVVEIGDAVDELLRLTSPVQMLGRTVTRDVTIGDVTKRDLVMTLPKIASST